MSKKMSSNKKFIIGASVTLLIVFGVTLGATYGITAANMDDPNYIKFHINNKVYDINEVQPTKSLKSGDSPSDNEFSANEVLNQFYSLALFGTTDYKTDDLTPMDGMKGNYLLSNDSDFNVPYAFDSSADAKEYRSIFTGVKLFKDTLNEPVLKYLTDLDSDSKELIDIMSTLDPEAKYADIKNDSPDTIDQIVAALSKEQSYQRDILEEMFVYSYLWQDSTSRKYDYKFTQALVESKPSMVAEMEIDTDKAGTPLLKPFTDVVENTPAVTATDWNAKMDSLKDAITDSTDVDNSPIEDSFNGFKGIQFGTTSNSMIKEDFYRTSNTWDLTSKNTDGEQITTTGTLTSENIMTDANYYVARDIDGAKGKGALIYSDGESFGDITGTATVTAYSQLYPYMFAKFTTEGGFDHVVNPTFSLFANNAGDGTLTSATKDDADAEYIFNRWFGEDNASKGEIYVAEAIIDNQSSIIDDAYEYWNDHGFYIELSGDSSDDYTSFLPIGVLKKED